MDKHYEVYCFTPCNSEHLQQWIEGIYKTTGLRLISSSDGYWIFEQTLLLDTTATVENQKVGSLAVDAMESYGEFYDKAVIALGFTSDSLPSTDMDNKMLKRISDMFWFIRHLADAIEVVYNKLPAHWRDNLPFSYFDLKNKVDTLLKYPHRDINL